MSVPNAVLKAAVLRLQQDPQLISKLGAGSKVFNNVPQDPESAGTLPYIVVRAQPAGTFGDKLADGWNIELSVDVYSAQHGDREALEISSRVRLLFDGPRLSLESGRVVCSYFQSGSVVDGDGQYRSASLSFLLLCEET